MDFKPAVERALRDKYVDFTGRAARSEYWWFVLFVFVVSIIASTIDAALFAPVFVGMGPVSLIFNLIILIPMITITARRLHDIDRTGWWQLLYFLPVIGFLVMIFFAVQKGTSGDNRFGPDPLGGGAGDPPADQLATEIPPSAG